MSKDTSQIVISKKTLVLAVILLLILLTVTVVVAVNWNNWFGEKEEETRSPGTVITPNGELEIDPGASDWNGNALPEQGGDTPAEGIKIPGYPSITLPKDQKTVNVALLNPEGNPCYFTFELVLKDSGETLYQSKLVPPGKAITEITMARALSAGEYAATIKITTTSTADGSAMNGANVETVLIVK